MIDFRYHVVSLISVFLAIALGIVIGTTALNGPVLNNLSGQVSDLKTDKRALEDRSRALESELAQNDEFDAAMAPKLVAGVLQDRKVLIISAGDSVSADSRDQLVALLGQAGAQVTGQVQLRDDYSDPAVADSLQAFATGDSLPPGINLPATDDVGQVIGALLAKVLLVKDGAQPEPQASIAAVLSGLASLGVLATNGDPTPADLAIVLTQGAAPDNVEDRNKTLLGLVQQLDQAGSGTVVAGDPASAGEDGLVGAIRADAATASTVSTVDNADGSSGQINAIFALVAEAAGQQGGHYGIGENTQPVAPVPSAPATD